MHQNTQVTYTGTALPTDSDTFTLYDSTSDGVPLPHLGVKRFAFSIDHDARGTVSGSFSRDGGTTWTEFYSTEALPPVIAGDMTSDDVLVEPYEHVKFEWVNGGTTQTTFTPNLSLSCDRSPMDDTGKSFTRQIMDTADSTTDPESPRIDIDGIAGGSIQVAWGTGVNGTFTLYLSNKDDPTPGTAADWFDSGETMSSSPAGGAASTGHMHFRGLFARWAYLGFADNSGSGNIDAWAHIREEGR